MTTVIDREMMEKLAGQLSELAHTIASILAQNLGYNGQYFPENCNKSTCFLRLNRYPPCPFSPETFGLMPHTDSDYLTILYQDQVGGLQLMKDTKWVAVKPNPEALIVNIGDLFQVIIHIMFYSYFIVFPIQIFILAHQCIVGIVRLH